MIELVVISLIVLFYLAIKLLGNNLSRPSVLYIGGFLASSLVALKMKSEWELEKMSFGTVFFIVGGALLFFCIELYDYKTHPQRNKTANNILTINKRYTISNTKLILFWLFQLFSYWLMAKAKTAYANTGSLSDALVMINDSTKFEGEVVQLPFYINIPYNISTYAGYLWSILLPYYQFETQKFRWQKALILLNFLTVFVGCYLSGGRQMFLTYIVSYLSFLYLCYRSKMKWKGSAISRKGFIWLVAIGVSFILLFNSIGTIMGRDDYDEKGLADVIFTMYCGAQIKNLDNHIQSPERVEDDKLFASYTFKNFYDKVSNRLGQKPISRKVTTSFNEIGGYPLGNVYSTYFNYFYDFGFYGILLVPLMSFFFAVLYRETLNSDFWITGRVNMYMLFYASFVICPLLSFFSNQFFGSLVLSYLVRNYIIWKLLIYFLVKRESKVNMLNLKMR